MKASLVSFAGSALAASAICLTECSNNGSNCDGGCPADGSAPTTVSGGGCDSSKPASQGGCAVADVDGFFVSPQGSDSANGAKATPFLTINKGILAAAAAPLKPNVYVCAGTFPENLVIQNAPAGVALHGGFDCASWAQINAPTVVAPPYATSATPQYVLHVLGMAALVESMTLTAPDATDPGVSSIAAFIDGSPGMTFRRATVTSGAATDGATPTPLTALTANSSGNAGTTTAGGATLDCKCTTTDSIGGQGGTPVDGGAPASGLPVISGADAGQAGLPSVCPGNNGANGLNAKDGTSTGTLGALSSASGWTSSAGGTGFVGGTGQGGGGAYWQGNGIGGGGGACGGCGGSGGVGGGGGGASIAVGATNSTLRVRVSTLKAGKAGNGGNGVVGQPGQPGGTGGISGGSSCVGGNGGTGGMGGAGGGGAGGVSVAIATFNATPDVDAQSTVLAGAAGQGGHDATAQAAKAIDGIAEAVHSF